MKLLDDNRKFSDERDVFMSDSEVRYHYLRPKQIIEKRKEFPVAYIPIGTIEWHGVHMPTGAVGIQAEGLAELCAKKGAA